MGGRGRGRAALSFNVESLGIAPGESLPGPQLQPPPVYPLLEASPAPLLPSIAMTRKLQYKHDFLNHFKKFGVNYRLAVPGDKRKSSGDAAADSSTQSKGPAFLDFRWNCFPAELRPDTMSKRNAANQRNKDPHLKFTDIDQLLAELERAETRGAKIKEEGGGDEPNRQKNNDEANDLLDEEFADSDLEMDDGTDYNQNYFDNGDNYLDEEDDDDGPIY